MKKKKWIILNFCFREILFLIPKHAKSYLYLAKIFHFEKKKRGKKKKNLNTTLLLEPSNEQAMYMLIEIELKDQTILE